MKLASLISLRPLKEMANMRARELADSYSLDELQFHLDQIYMDMEQEAEPEGGPIADQYADEIHAYEAAIRLAKGDSGGEMTYDQAIAKHYGKSPIGAGAGGPIFESESKWNALDVSRKAEKEIDNKEWNERTTKKLNILKGLNSKGAFKKDWDEEKLQGWIDQNYSWEKVTKQFKNINEIRDFHNPLKGVASFDHIGKPPGPKPTKYYSAVEVTKEMWNRMDPKARMDSLLTVYKDSNEASKYIDFKFDNLPPNSEMTVDEGTCGYGPNGVPGKTPGGTKGTDADIRTRGMIKNFIQKEVRKLTIGKPPITK